MSMGCKSGKPVNHVDAYLWQKSPSTQSEKNKACTSIQKELTNLSFASLRMFLIKFDELTFD